MAPIILQASLKYIGFALIYRALQYSQYAGYQPDWAQSTVAATFGFGPGDKIMFKAVDHCE